MTHLKEMVDDAEDDSAAEEEDDAAGELQFDLDRPRKTRPDLAPEDLNADTLIDFDIEIVTYESQPLSIDEIVNIYHNRLKFMTLKISAVTRMIFPTIPYRHHRKMKSMRQLRS